MGSARSVGEPARRGGSAARVSWSSPRILLPASFFAGLVALEVVRGIDRLEAQRARHEQELELVLERQLEQLAREVEETAGEGGRHALHLARSAAVRALVRAPGDEGRAALERQLLPYLVSFRGIDRISVLDDEGRELARCERMGEGVAALPAHLFGEQPLARELVQRAAPGAVAVSALVDDAQRVEVAEADRRVFHYAARAAEGRGIVVVTVYAAPLLHALADFRPLPGVATALCDEEGRVLLASAPAEPAGPAGAAPPDVATALAREPAALAALRAEQRAREADALLLARPVRAGPAALLVCLVPDAALARAAGGSPGELVALALPTVAIAGLIALSSAFFVRATLRSRRLRETEHWLARIADASRRHRALMEAAADLILIVDPLARRVRDWNGRAGELFGLARAAPAAREGAPGEGAPEPAAIPLEALATSFDDAGRELLARTIDAALERAGTARAAEPLRGRGKGGERLELELACVALELQGERVVLLLLSDRTREFEMERQVRIAERLSSLGLLTAGVAHEINNPLEGIANYLTLLEKSDVPERRARYLGEVRRGFQRIRDIVGDLLRFGRPESGTGDLSRAVREALAVARYTKDLRHVEVRLEGLDEPLGVRGAEGRLQQVFLNLLLNAGRAMEGRGRITIEAAQPEPGWIEVRVADEGPGIPEEDLGRVFDPFFTKSGGTGLGLAVSYGIVRAHGGVLSARNRAQGGAELLLRLPREPSEERGTA